MKLELPDYLFDAKTGVTPCPSGHPSISRPATNFSTRGKFSTSNFDYCEDCPLYSTTNSEGSDSINGSSSLQRSLDQLTPL